MLDLSLLFLYVYFKFKSVLGIVDTYLMNSHTFFWNLLELLNLCFAVWEHGRTRYSLVERFCFVLRVPSRGCVFFFLFSKQEGLSSK